MSPRGSPRDVSVCPQALQEEALPSARNTLPSCPSIPPRQPRPATVGLGPGPFPSCQGPKHLAKQKCLLGEEQRRVAVLVVPYSHLSLGHSWVHRVSRLFHSHQGDLRWIRVTLRASTPSVLSCPSPGGTCATQNLLNMVGKGFTLVAPTASFPCVSFSGSGATPWSSVPV